MKAFSGRAVLTAALAVVVLAGPLAGPLGCRPRDTGTGGDLDPQAFAAAVASLTWTLDALAADLGPFVTKSSEAAKVTLFKNFIAMKKNNPLPWPFPANNPAGIHRTR